VELELIEPGKDKQSVRTAVVQVRVFLVFLMCC